MRTVECATHYIRYPVMSGCPICKAERLSATAEKVIQITDRYVYRMHWWLASALMAVIVLTGVCIFQFIELQWWRCQPHYQEPGHPTPVDDETGDEIEPNTERINQLVLPSRYTC